jgi:hypothetical protein
MYLQCPPLCIQQDLFYLVREAIPHAGNDAYHATIEEASRPHVLTGLKIKHNSR